MNIPTYRRVIREAGWSVVVMVVAMMTGAVFPVIGCQWPPGAMQCLPKSFINIAKHRCRLFEQLGDFILSGITKGFTPFFELAPVPDIVIDPVRQHDP
ncbi:MAG: hypothetical protein Kow0089_01670 [Desulfobulbaceae bacterium]